MARITRRRTRPYRRSTRSGIGTLRSRQRVRKVSRYRKPRPRNRRRNIRSTRVYRRPRARRTRTTTRNAKHSHRYRPRVHEAHGVTASKSTPEDSNAPVLQKDVLEFSSAWGAPAPKGQFFQFWGTSLSQLHVADPTDIHRLDRLNGFRTGSSCLAIGASITAAMVIRPKTSWVVRFLLYTTNNNLPARPSGLRMDGPTDTMAAISTDDFGNFFWDNHVETFIPGVVQPPFSPFRMARPAHLQTYQELYRNGSPSAQRLWILMDQKIHVRNDGSKPKPQRYNVFTRLSHWLQYESITSGGRLNIRQTEAQRPLNLLIIAHPKTTDGNAPVPRQLIYPGPPDDDLMEADPRPELDEDAEHTHPHLLSKTYTVLEAELIDVDRRIADTRTSLRVISDPQPEVTGVQTRTGRGGTVTPVGPDIQQQLEENRVRYQERLTRLEGLRESILERMRIYARTRDRADRAARSRPAVAEDYTRRAVYGREQSMPPESTPEATVRAAFPVDDESYAYVTRSKDLDAEDDDPKPFKAFDRYQKAVADQKASLPYGFTMEVSTRLWFNNSQRSIGLPLR